MSTVDRVRDLVSPLLADLGLDVYDIEHQGGTLRILIDAEGGVGMDALTTATRLVSRALDDADAVTGSYTLEVSSPGLERPLRTPAHFAAAVGRDISVKTVSGYQGERRLTGRLVAAEAEDFTLLADDGAEVSVPYEAVSRARTVFDWGPAPHPKSKQTKRSTNQKARAS